jgi:SAM-dependent methyltransferase
MGLFVPAYVDDCAPLVRERNRELCARFCRSGGRVLDLGAGAGTLSRMLVGTGFTVDALDRERHPPAVDGVQRLCADLNDGIPVADSSYDAIVAQEVIHLLENPWSLFREAARVLTPDGLFLLSTPNVDHLCVRLYELLFGECPHFRDTNYRVGNQITPIPLWSVRRMAERAGFEHLLTTYNMGYLPVLRLALPFRSARLGHTLMLAYRKRSERSRLDGARS